MFGLYILLHYILEEHTANKRKKLERASAELLDDILQESSIVLTPVNRISDEVFITVINGKYKLIAAYRVAKLFENPEEIKIVSVHSPDGTPIPINCELSEKHKNFIIEKALQSILISWQIPFGARV